MNWKLSDKILIQGASQPTAIQYLNDQENHLGIKIVAGISSGWEEDYIGEVPIFDLVEEVISNYGQIDTTILFNPPEQILDAGYEAMESGIKQIILNTPKVPPLDLVQLFQKASQKNTLIIGPGQGGIILPNQYCFGLIETKFFQQGNIGIINHGDPTLSYEMALELNQASLGESMVINLGGEKIIGMDFGDWLKILAEQTQTSAIILIASDYNYLSSFSLADDLIKEIKKPIIAYFPDCNNLKSANINSSKMIAEQVPFFLGHISPPESIINRLQTNQIAIAYTPSEVIKLIQKLKIC